MIKATQTKLISIVSGKGGVGKSVLSANIAYQLSTINKKVLIVDTDIMCPNQHLIFGCDPILRLDDWVHRRTTALRTIHSVSANLDLISGSTGNNNFELQDKISFLDLYQEILLATDYNYVLFDTAAGISKNLIECCSFSDEIILIITDEPTSILDAYGLLKILRNYCETKKIKLLLNNIIDDEDANIVGNKFNMATEHFLGTKLNILGMIPYSRAVRQSILRQELLSIIFPETEVALSIKKISELI